MDAEKVTDARKECQEQFSISAKGVWRKFEEVSATSLASVGPPHLSFHSQRCSSTVAPRKVQPYSPPLTSMGMESSPFSPVESNRFCKQESHVSPVLTLVSAANSSVGIHRHG